MASVETQRFLSSATIAHRNIGQYSFGLGETIRVKLDPYGVIVGVWLSVQARITIATTAAVPSDLAPHSLISKIVLQDNRGRIRINTDAALLWVRNSLAGNNRLGYTGGFFYQAPSVPASIGASQLYEFVVYVPIAYSETDLGGAILIGSNYELYIDVTFVDQLLGVDNCEYPYVGQPTSVITLVSGSVSAFQRSLTSNQRPPVGDMNYVHYLEGSTRITDNISANSEKLIDYPIDRTIYNTYIRYINNGQVSYGDLSSLRMLVNSVETLRYDEQSQRAMMIASAGGSPLPFSHFYVRHSAPVVSPIARVNQIGFTPQSAGAPGSNTYLGVLFESVTPQR